MVLHLQSPLEALVLRYSATIAGYIWTCLALIAAGIGLWRFRLLGSASRSTPTPAFKFPSAAVFPAIPQQPAASAPIVSTMVEPNCSEHEECRTSTKGRFTAYFIVEEEIDDGDKGDEYERGSYYVSDDGQCLGLLDWRWTGDLGWYSYQDWKAINGSVVKLWDGGPRGSASAPVVKGK